MRRRASGIVYDTASGALNVTRLYDLAETPIFVKAGAIIPGAPMPCSAASHGTADARASGVLYNPGDVVATAQRQYEMLVLSIYPGAAAGETQIYEDDGETTAYAGSAFAWTTARYERDRTTVRISVNTSGTYPEQPSRRALQIRLVSSYPLVRVTADGRDVPYVAYRLRGTPAADGWTYCGKTLSAVIWLAPRPLARMPRVEATAYAGDAALMNGVRGGMARAIASKYNLALAVVSPDMERRCPHLQRASVVCDVLASLAARGDHAGFEQELRAFPALLAAAAAEAALPVTTASRRAYSVTLLRSALPG